MSMRSNPVSSMSSQTTSMSTPKAKPTGISSGISSIRRSNQPSASSLSSKKIEVNYEQNLMKLIASYENPKGNNSEQKQQKALGLEKVLGKQVVKYLVEHPDVLKDLYEILKNAVNEGKKDLKSIAKIALKERGLSI